MSPNLIVLVATCLLLVLLSIRIPVAFALLLSGIVGLFLLDGSEIAWATLARLPYQTPARYILVVIPLFIAMGIFAKSGRLATQTFELARRWLGRFPGGLAVATILSCGLFAAVSGSSVATVATMAPMAVPEMRKAGYDVRLAAGVVGASGTLGVLIPPSVAIVIYGIITQVSIGQLLIGGIVPGLLSAIVYGAAIVGRSLLRPELVGAAAPRSRDATSVPSEPNPPVRVLTTSIAPILRVSVLFLLVIGGIYTGVATVAEAAALGAVGAFAMLIADQRSSDEGALRTAGSAIGETVTMTAMVFALLIGAAVFTSLIVRAGVPRTVTTWVTGLEVSGLMVVCLILLAFIPLGMFLDPLSLMLIGVPLAFPIITELGFDGVWFGILVIKTIEIGLITPPFGLNGYVTAGSSPGVSVEDAFRGILWFLPFDIATLLLILFIPNLVLWLPSFM